MLTKQLSLRFVGPEGAPNTGWDLMRAPSGVVGGFGVVFLPVAWLEEVETILANPVLVKKFDDAFAANDFMGSRFLGWGTSCLLRDRALLHESVETRATILIELVGMLRDRVNRLTGEQLASVVTRVERGNARDFNEMLNVVETFNISLKETENPS